jgi:hypothetical protein
MKPSGSRAAGAGLAILTAGPAFLVSLILAHHYLLLPKVVLVTATELSLVVPALTLSVIVGGIVSTLPISACALLMSALANRLKPLRPLPVWIVAGAALPILACYFLAQSPPQYLIFALGFTGATSATLCRRTIHWEAEFPEGSATAPNRDSIVSSSVPAHAPLTSLLQKR